LQAAQNGLERLRSQVDSFRTETNRTMLSEEKEGKIETFRNEFLEALGDDLNTPQALAVLWEMLGSNIPSGDKYDLSMSFDEILGLKLGEAKSVEIPENVKVMMGERERLRSEGKFEEADKVREQIQKLGFSVSDKPLS
jgi:cysteinyl-tRNA synthetase